jgi:hypothetical protein
MAVNLADSTDPKKWMAIRFFVMVFCIFCKISVCFGIRLCECLGAWFLGGSEPYGCLKAIKLKPLAQNIFCGFGVTQKGKRAGALSFPGAALGSLAHVLLTHIGRAFFPVAFFSCQRDSWMGFEGGLGIFLDSGISQNIALLQKVIDNSI